MRREAIVYCGETAAGLLSEQDEGYVFQYLDSYLDSADARAVSLTLPVRKEPFMNKTMFPFFDGLIPEGWLLDVAVQTWKLDSRDRMGLLLTCCKDCIGAISVMPAKEGVNNE
jgi:serine/threonine-protein kinase HipA